MPRGKAVPVGAHRVAPNGYHYQKMPNGKWELIHRLIAQQKLGRPLRPDERARFVDNDKTNFRPDNIAVYTTKGKTVASEIARLESKRDDIQARIDELRAEQELS